MLRRTHPEHHEVPRDRSGGWQRKGKKRTCCFSPIGRARGSKQVLVLVLEILETALGEIGGMAQTRDGTWERGSWTLSRAEKSLGTILEWSPLEQVPVNESHA